MSKGTTLLDLYTVKTEKPVKVDAHPDGQGAGYTGAIKCARCGETAEIHPGGGNMCAICVEQI